MINIGLILIIILNKMKKVLFIFELIFLIQFQLFSQTTFEKLIHSDNNDNCYRVIEDKSGNFYVSVVRYGNNYKAYILKFDKFGNLQKDTIISSPNNIQHYIIDDLLLYNNSIICIGTKYNLSTPYNSKFWYLNLDSNLHVIKEQVINFSDSLRIYYFNTIIDSDTNIVLAGSSLHHSPLYLLPFLFKLKITGDSINSNLSITPFGEFYSLLQNPNSNGYYVFANHIFTSSNNRIIKVNNNLDTISSYEIAPYDMRRYYHSKWISDTSFIMNSMFFHYGFPVPDNNRDMMVSVIDTNFNILYQQEFGKDTIYDYPGLYNGVSVNGDNVYIGGTTNISISNLYVGTGQPSWFYLIKMDKNQNVLWEKRYGGDTYYLLNSIYATSDGGCIMAGTRKNSDVTVDNTDIYLLKVDSGGFYCWEKEIKFPKEMAKIFPNPFNNNINIELPKTLKFADVYMFDILGKQVLKSTISDTKTILNTAGLPNGIYIIKIVAEGENIFVGKAIKE